MDADKYLKDMLDAQTLKDDSEEMKALQKRRAEVEAVLRDGFKDSNPRIRYGGSKSKGTMNKDSYDLDITCYFANDDTKPGATLEEIYSNVKKVLEKKYQVSPKKTSLRLIGLDQAVHGQDFHIDVVPGRFTDKDEKDVFLHQEEGDKERLKTNLDVHVKHVKESGYTEAIRLQKLWRGLNDIEIKTFVLELLVIDILKPKNFTLFSSQAKYFWEQLRDKADTLTVKDPANEQGNDLSEFLTPELRKSLKQVATDTLAAIEKKGWEVVFGKSSEGKAAAKAEALIASVTARQAAGAMKPWLP